MPKPSITEKSKKPKETSNSLEKKNKQLEKQLRLTQDLLQGVQELLFRHRLPNLDTLTEEELRSTAATFANLRTYCLIMIGAREYRLGGQVDAALSLESAAEGYIKNLPEWAKW